MLLSMALFLAAAQVASEPAQNAVSPTLIKELVDAMPNEASDSRAEEEKELARLAGINPGHESELRAIVRDYFICLNPEAEAAAKRMLADMALRLGSDDRVRGLIRLYRNQADLDAFDRFAGMSERGEALTQEQSRELDRIMAEYPINDMMVATKAAVEAASHDPIYFAAVVKCSTAKKASLIGAKLRPS